MTEKIIENKKSGTFNHFDQVVDRRTALKIMGGIAGGVTIGSIIAGCGGGVQTQTQPAETAPVPTSSAKSPVETMTQADITKMPLNTMTVEQATKNATSTETVVVPTKTKEGVDYSAAFNVDPQSEADFGKVIDSPSPIDDPTDFAPWEDGYLAAVDAKLENYTGPFIESDLGGGNTNDQFFFNAVLVKPIAWYKYSWKSPSGAERTIITKSFPIRDKATGQKSTISITYAPVDDPFGYNGPGDNYGEYETATTKMPIEIWFDSGSSLKGRTPFSDEFLKHDGTGAEKLEEFLIGKGIDPSLDKEHFVFGGYR
jgi:hypothetical protein